MRNIRQLIFLCTVGVCASAMDRPPCPSGSTRAEERDQEIEIAFALSCMRIKQMEHEDARNRLLAFKDYLVNQYNKIVANT